MARGTSGTSGPVARLLRLEQRHADLEFHEIQRRIVQDAVAAYAACKTYRDRGTFVVASARRSNRTEQRIKFHTAFARPGRFRYRLFHDPDDGPPQERIIWSDGKTVRLWQPGEGEVRLPSISAAVSALDMASRLPTATISGLLMPERVGGSFLTTASALVLQGQQDLGNTPCHRVRGRDSYGLNFTAWFEKKRRVLRKLRIKFHGYEEPVWIEADYAVRLDSKITDKQLAYDPPTDDAG